MTVINTNVSSLISQNALKVNSRAIAKAMNHEPSIDWLLKNQASTVQCFHQMALDASK